MMLSNWVVIPAGVRPFELFTLFLTHPDLVDELIHSASTPIGWISFGIVRRSTTRHRGIRREAIRPERPSTAFLFESPNLTRNCLCSNLRRAVPRWRLRGRITRAVRFHSQFPSPGQAPITRQGQERRRSKALSFSSSSLPPMAPHAISTSAVLLIQILTRALWSV